MIFVLTYDGRALVKKVVFGNGTSLDIFPAVQELLYSYRQKTNNDLEAGGILIGYENARTGIFTVTNATEPQSSDVRSRVTLSLGAQHRELLMQIEPPYGYIGTWHTHPSEMPSPSSVDLRDWKKCIEKNGRCTSGLIFIIAGTESFRVWLYDSSLNDFVEGTIQ